MSGDTISICPAEILIERLRKYYNTKRRHSALGYRPLAQETIISIDDWLVRR
jgi:hypothetical protein